MQISIFKERLSQTHPCGGLTPTGAAGFWGVQVPLLLTRPPYENEMYHNCEQGKRIA